MKRQVTYSFDRDDGNPLSAEHLDQIYHLLIGFATEQEKSAHEPHPGLKALRHVKGNHFTLEHVEEFRSFVGELTERAAARIVELEKERDRLTKEDPFSRKAYDGMIDSIRSNRSLALRDMEQFMVYFREQVENDIPGHAFAI